MMMLNQTKRLLAILVLLCLASCGDDEPYFVLPEPVLLHQVPVVKNNVIYISFEAFATTKEGFITGLRIAKNGMGIGDLVQQYWTDSITVREAAQWVNNPITIRLNAWNILSTGIGQQGYAYVDATYTFFYDQGDFQRLGVIIKDSEGTFKYIL